MIVAVAQGQFGHPRPLHKQADIFFIGHADTAEHLHGFTTDEIGSVRGAGLGGAEYQAAILAVVVNGAQGGQGQGDGQFLLTINISRPVF